MAELPNLAEARGKVEALREKLEVVRGEMLQRSNAFEDLRRSGEARAQRLQKIAQEQDTWRKRLATATARSAELSGRKDGFATELAQAKTAPEELAQQRETLSQDLTRADARLAEVRNILSEAEAALRAATEAEREAERHASDAREARAGAEARAEAAGEAVRATSERNGEALQLTPNQLRAQLDAEADSPKSVEAIEADVNRLKRQRDALGAVNLRAEEDAREVQSEHDTLIVEKSDLDEAIRTLRNGIASLNREGRERLLMAGGCLPVERVAAQRLVSI